MKTEEMLAEILTRLEEMNTQLRSIVDPSPPSTSILTADIEEREISASTSSTKLTATTSTSLIPSPTSAPPQDADHGSQSGIDRLSCVPDSLLRDIISRLPIKDAARTAVLSRRWSPISGASAVLHLEHPGLRFHDIEGPVPSELFDPRADWIRGLIGDLCAARGIPFAHGAGKLEDHDPSMNTAARAWRPPWLRASRSTLSWRRCSSSSQDLHSYIAVANQNCASITSRSILSGRGFSFTVPSGTASNQDVTCATYIGSTEFLSVMHTWCSIQGLRRDEVTILSPCAFSTSAIAISALHHEENASELLRIPLLLELVKLQSFGDLRMPIFGVFMDWQEQPWPPPMLMEIFGSQFEDSVIKLRPTPWSSFCCSCSKVEVQSNEQWASVGYVSLDVGLYGSKEKMTWHYYLQFVIESVCMHHVPELRPMLRLPSSRRRWGELLKSSWPPSTQDECKSDGIDNWSVYWLSLGAVFPCLHEHGLCSAVMDSYDMGFISSSLVQYDGLVLCCLGASRCAHKVFKVMPVFLFLPTSSCYSVWNLHSVLALRSLAWPQFHYKRDAKFWISPWPPPMLMEILGSKVEHSIAELRPNPWPSFERSLGAVLSILQSRNYCQFYVKEGSIIDERSVSLIKIVTYWILSYDTNLQQLGQLTGFSIIWDLSIHDLLADPSKCREEWKAPWVSYVSRNIAGHFPTSRFIMVFWTIIIAEENWKHIVYISGAVMLEFWWPVALFQSCHYAILFDLEACQLSCGWIINYKLFSSTDGLERDGFSLEENCPAMQGEVGLILPRNKQSSLGFHPLAETRRTVLPFHQELLLFDNMSFTVHRKISLWVSPQGHTDACGVVVNWACDWALLKQLLGIKQGIHISGQGQVLPFLNFLAWLQQKLSGVLWTNFIKDLRATLWDPGGYIHNLQATILLARDNFLFKLQCRSNDATFQHVFCWCFQTWRAASRLREQYIWHGLLLTKDCVCHSLPERRMFSMVYCCHGLGTSRVSRREVCQEPMGYGLI